MNGYIKVWVDEGAPYPVDFCPPVEDGYPTQIGEFRSRSEAERFAAREAERRGCEWGTND